MRGPERSAVIHTWTDEIRQAVEKPVHHTSDSGYAQSRGDQINIRRVGCLCLLFLALATALVMVWAVISEHDGERLEKKVQTVFSFLILGRMHHRGACRVLAYHTHTIL